MSFFDAPGDEEQHVDERYEPENTSIPLAGKFFNSQHGDGDSDSENKKRKSEEWRHMEVAQQPLIFLPGKANTESQPESVTSIASEIPTFTTSPTTSGSPFTSIPTSDETVTQVRPETPVTCSNLHCACSRCSCGPGCRCGVAQHRQEQKEENQQFLQSSATTAALPGLSAPRLLPVKPIKPLRPRPVSSSAILSPSDNKKRPSSSALADDDEETKPAEFDSSGASSAESKKAVTVKPAARPASPIQPAECKEIGTVTAHPAEQEPDPVQPLINKLHEKLRTTSRSLPPLALNVAKQQKEAVVSMADLLVEDPLTLLPVINALHKRISKLEKKVFGQNEHNQQQTQSRENSPEPDSQGIQFAGA